MPAFETAVSVLQTVIAEDRDPTKVEKKMLAGGAVTLLLDLHSIADSLKRIAGAMEERSS